MSHRAPTTHELSARRIIGFACHQAFLFFLLFVGPYVSETGAFPLETTTLLVAPAALVVGFAIVRLLGSKRVEKLLARPLLYIYAVVAAGGVLVGFAAPDEALSWSMLAGFLAAIPSALLLTAWGQAFDRQPSRISISEVLLGSLIGALICLIFTLTASSDLAFYGICILPFASVVNIEAPSQEEARAPASLEATSGQARVLSLKILAGTVLFGMAAGLMELHRMGATGASLAYFQIVLVLLGAFLLGALSLQLSDGFGRGAALNKSYRLTVFVMMMGALITPWPLLATSALPGEAVVLAGYLGLEAVLISLFLVLAEITGTDCVRTFSQGFLALFAGFFGGELIGSGIGIAASDASANYALIVLTGGLILLSYVFLFTERDFDALSQIVSASDTLEERCGEIVTEYGLSNREAEILAYAVRGRTSERIAQELVISKSTVDTHLRRIYAKCNVHSRQELLDLAERTNWP